MQHSLWPSVWVLQVEGAATAASAWHEVKKYRFETLLVTIQACIVRKDCKGSNY